MNQKIIKVSGVMNANNGVFLCDAAVSGLGILRIPTFIAHEAIVKGQLIPILQDFLVPDINAYAIYPPTRHLSQRVRRFIDFLVDRFSETDYWK